MTSRKLKLLLIAAAGLSLAGTCADAQGLFGPGKFRVEQSDDRFSASPTTTFIGLNNRLTKRSPVGGIYISAEGFYMNPVVVKSRGDGSIARIGFALENRTEIDTSYGSPNSLGSLQKVSFLVDGTHLIAADVVAGDQQFSDAVAYNTISRSASSGLTESGTIYLQPSDMAMLAGASTVAVQIQGSRKTWTVEAKDVSKSFLTNLATFYHQQVTAGR